MSHWGLVPRPRRTSAPLVLLCACVCLAIWTHALSAQATLSSDVERLTAMWARESRVERLRPRLLARGERLSVPISSWGSIKGSSGCTNLAVMSSPGISFVLHLIRNGEVQSRPSQVGWAQVTRCGGRRWEHLQAVIEMRSPRGVVEMIVARSRSPLPSTGWALAHRDSGPAREGGQAGNAPGLPPLELRASAWEARAKRDGAARIVRQVLPGQHGEMPPGRMELAEGCHRISVLGLQAAGGASARDLDLVVRGEPGSELTLQDQSENSDAEVEGCVGSLTWVKVEVPGRSALDPALLLHGRFPLPQGLPRRWGPELRARFAAAFFRRSFLGRPGSPIYESLGVAGRTVLPVNLELHTCYVAAASVIQGSPSALQLEVAPADSDSRSDGSSDQPAVVVGFCTGDDGLARLQVQAAGRSLAWLVAVWRIERHFPAEGPS